MKVVVSNPGLGSHVRQTVRAYEESGKLESFYSTLIIKDKSPLALLSKNNKTLKSRKIFEIPNHRIKRLIIPEVLRLFSSKFFSNNTTDKIWEWSEHLFDKWVSRKITKDISMFHGYEHASLFSLKRCKELGVFTVYEQPSAHNKYIKEKILEPLFRNEPYFKSNFQNLYDSELSQKRNTRRDEEINTSELIICNSTYVKKSLTYAGINESKIIVHPLGFPEVDERTIVKKDKIRFIISGNLSYLKGTHHILRVWKSNQHILKNHELICIGTDVLAKEEWEQLPENVIKMNRMNSVDYLSELAKADVYILNTYSDGFGMVMSEAMANGLAVIGTENSAACDIIENDVTGKIISIANEEQLLQSMKWMVENSEKLVEMRIAARDFAKNHSWNNYRTELTRKIFERYNVWKSNG